MTLCACQGSSGLTCCEPSRLGEMAENSDSSALRTSAPNPAAVDSRTGEGAASSSEKSPGEARACAMAAAAERGCAEGTGAGSPHTVPTEGASPHARYYRRCPPREDPASCPAPQPQH